MLELASDLLAEYESVREEAIEKAGKLCDLENRAQQYAQLHVDSGGNHCFPLIAAHGARWASKYFRFGVKLGATISRCTSIRTSTHNNRVGELHELADAFREVNRQVFIETYATFHFSDRFGHHSEAETCLSAPVLRALNDCHAARRASRPFSNKQKRELYRLFFLNEQEHIVGPLIQKAIDELDWRLIKPIVLRPRVRFAFQSKAMVFRDFCNLDERISRGLQAFDDAARFGFSEVYTTLDRY